MSVENGCVSVEFHLVEDTLGVRHVRSGESLDLPVLQGAVLVVEAFRAGSGGGGQVLVGLELPVGPAGEVLVSNVADLVDLLSTRALSEASTELGDYERDAKALSIGSSCSDSLLVPGKALVGVSDLWLA